MELLNYGGTYVVLNGRYALMECLAESTSGKIYRGYDLDKIRDNGLASQVLIHVLPAMLAASAHRIFQQIQQAYEGLSTRAGVLPACAYGDDAATAYIVLEGPECAGTHSLSRETNPRAASWRVAAQRLAPLIKRHALPKQVDPALLLSTPEQRVYVLATAFSPALQALVQTEKHAACAARQYHLRRLAIGVSSAALMAFGAVTAHALMQQVAPANKTVDPATSILPVMPSPVAKTVSTPVESTPLPTPQRPAVAVKPPPVRQAVVVKPVPSQQAVEMRATPTATVSKPTQPARPVVSKAASAVTEAVVQPAVKVQPAVAEEATLPEPAPIVAQVVIEDDASVRIDSAIQQAYDALAAGRLNDAPQGALRFTRELRGLAPQHPQVARLGQEITAAYLRHIRAALQVHDLQQVERLLPVTRKLIAEFQLENLEAAQQVLENKLVELNG
ncbi:MAG: hypothetical protein ACK4RS_04750 [Thiothrix sp.]